MSGLFDRLAVLALSPELPVSSRVLLTLVCHAGRTGTAYPGVPSMARRLNVTERSVRRALAQLEKAGLIQCDARGKGGRGCGMTRWRVAPGAADGAWLLFVKEDESGPPFDAETLTGSDTVSAAAAAETLTDCGRNPDGSGSKPCPNPSAEPNPRTDGTTGPARDFYRVLKLHGMVPTGNPHRFALQLLRAIEEGLTPDVLARLCRLATAEADVNSTGLLVHWLSTPLLWSEVDAGAVSTTRYKPTASETRGAEHVGRIARRPG